MAAGYEDSIGSVFHVDAPRNIAYHGGPTNGVTTFQESPEEAFQDVLLWNSEAHAQGWKTIVSTMISRCGNNGYQGESGDQLKREFNALLLANSEQFDWVANQAAAPPIGADGACLNPTYFSDAAGGFGTHISDAGQKFYVATERAGFEGVYGSSSTAIASTYT